MMCLFVLIFSSLSCLNNTKLKKRDFTVLIAKSPEALDPRFVSSAIGMRISQLIFAPLFEIGEDLKAKPYLAESLKQISPLEYHVTLRKGLYFHDGEELTSEDVVYTFKRLSDPDVRSIHSGKFKNIVSVSALSPILISFKLEKEWASFPLELPGLGIVSRSCANKTAYCREHWNGAGAYKVQNWNTAEERLELVAHEKFFKGAPQIKKVLFRVVRNQSIRLIEMMHQNADLTIGDISPEAIPLMEKQKHLKLVQKEGLGYSYLAMNLRGSKDSEQEKGKEQKLTLKALANISVRKALAHAINIDRIIASKWRNRAKRANSMLPKGHWAKNTGIRSLDYDPMKARALLNDAGFPKRVNTKNRFHLTINSTPVRLRRSIALLIKEDLEAVGIEVDVRVSEWSTLYQEIKRGNFEIFSAKWTPVVEPDLMHWVFHSSNIPTPNHAGGNRGAYINKEVDALLEKGRETSIYEDRRLIYQKVEEQLAKDLPYIPLWFEEVIAIEDRRLTNFPLTRTANFLGLAEAEYH